MAMSVLDIASGSLREAVYLLNQLFRWILAHTKLCLGSALLLASIGLLSLTPGVHQPLFTAVGSKLWWCLYWLGLGVLSSVGLGTGLHTFLLYLGPHIASVTLAAYECGSLDFPQPPYPDEIVCPDSRSEVGVSLLQIMSKVRLEAFMWGAGTALGELPPYFVARAHRLAGQQTEDEELIPNGDAGPKPKSWSQRAKKWLIRLVTRAGFFGILACASIPNPLFDLAGITCGYSMIPFTTFFGATLIGKAVIKMHIQKLFVIVAFNENYVEYFVNKMRIIPYVGRFIHEPFREFLAKQKMSLHRQAGQPSVKEPSWLAWFFEKLVMIMIIYFVVSIIKSMAENNMKRRNQYVQQANGFKQEAVSNSHLPKKLKKNKKKVAAD